jgi:hypothetical protein
MTLHNLETPAMQHARSRRANLMAETAPNGHGDRGHHRAQRRRFYTDRTIEQRAAVAVGMIVENGWTVKQVAGLLCVNPMYVALARDLSEEDRLRLSRGRNQACRSASQLSSTAG